MVLGEYIDKSKLVKGDVYWVFVDNLRGGNFELCKYVEYKGKGALKSHINIHLLNNMDLCGIHRLDYESRYKDVVDTKGLGNELNKDVIIRWLCDAIQQNMWAYNMLMQNSIALQGSCKRIGNTGIVIENRLRIPSKYLDDNGDITEGGKLFMSKQVCYLKNFSLLRHKKYTLKQQGEYLVLNIVYDLDYTWLKNILESYNLVTIEGVLNYLVKYNIYNFKNKVKVSESLVGIGYLGNTVSK